MAEAHSKKASDELLDLMNRAIAREMQVSIQYMWQHIQWVGVKGFTVRDQLKLIAINEMTHAELIAAPRPREGRSSSRGPRSAAGRPPAGRKRGLAVRPDRQ